MSSPLPPITRREPRFTVTRPDATNVTIVVDDPEFEEHVYRGTVNDMSSKGMRVSMNRPLALGTSIQLQLLVPETNVDFLSMATVRWCQPKDGDTWWIGCSLETSVPEHDLLEMATNDILDRRQDVRRPIDYQAQAQWQLSSDVVDVTIVDYSIGGCCLIAQNPDETSERVMLVLTDRENERTRTARLPLRIMWKATRGKKFAVGCSFVSKDGYLILKRFVDETDTKFKFPFELQKSTKWRWAVVAAFILLATKIIELIDKPSSPPDNQQIPTKYVSDQDEEISSDADE